MKKSELRQIIKEELSKIVNESKSNPEVDKLLKIINTKKAGPEYKKALMDLIAMAEKKSGTTINTKKEALLALDYIEPSIKESGYPLDRQTWQDKLENTKKQLHKIIRSLLSSEYGNDWNEDFKYLIRYEIDDIDIFTTTKGLIAKEEWENIGMNLVKELESEGLFYELVAVGNDRISLEIIKK
jgi:hypothetical protein